MNRLAGALQVARALLRLPVVVLLLTYAACGLAAAGDVSVPGFLRAAAVVVPFVTCSALVNDLGDERIDRINLSGTSEGANRLLLQGKSHRRAMVALAVAAGVGDLGAAYGLGGEARRTVLVVAATGLAVMLGYCVRPVRLADRGVVASLALPACYVATPFVVGLLLGRGAVRASDLGLLAALYIGFVARIVLKDLRDVRGDAMFGKRTFIVRHGRAATCLFSAVAWVAGSGLLIATTPHPTGVHRIQIVVTAIIAVALLRQLASDRGPQRDERLVSAIAIVGRAVLLGLLIMLSAGPAGVSAPVAAGLLLTCSGLLLWQARIILAHGPAPRRAVESASAALALTANTDGIRDSGDGARR
ncbi:MAG: UbiA family prenyltransferase [Nostocoides sp.]